MSNRRNRLAYAVATVLAGTGFAAAAPGIAVAQEADAAGHRGNYGDRAAPHTVAAGRADRDAGRGQRPDCGRRCGRPRRSERLRAGAGGVERQPDAAALSDPRHPDGRLRRRHRPRGGRVCRRHLCGALRRIAACLQRHRAYRSPQGTAGHAVRTQQRRRRDLDRHPPACKRIRLVDAGALWRVRQAVLRGHAQHADH